MDAFGNTEIKDFEFSPEPKRFRLYKGDNEFVFSAAPALPLGMLAATAKLSNINIKDADLEPFLAFFDSILIGDSVSTMREYAASKERPLGVQHIGPLVNWLLEAYGLRPTEASSPSSIGSADDVSTNSTDGVPVAE